MIGGAPPAGTTSSSSTSPSHTRSRTRTTTRPLPLALPAPRRGRFNRTGRKCDYPVDSAESCLTTGASILRLCPLANTFEAKPVRASVDRCDICHVGRGIEANCTDKIGQRHAASGGKREVRGGFQVHYFNVIIDEHHWRLLRPVGNNERSTPRSGRNRRRCIISSTSRSAHCDDGETNGTCCGCCCCCRCTPRTTPARGSPAVAAALNTAPLRRHCSRETSGTTLGG